MSEDYNNLRDTLVKSLQPFNIVLDEQALQRFEKYCDMLLDWNTRINLTAIKTPGEVALKHFADSLTILHFCGVKQGARVIDIGTGAGFPGVPLKIARNDLRLTLLDSLNKRLLFLNALLSRLQLDAALVHARAEEGGLQKPLRQQFDFATSRAVASLNLLSEYCLPYVKVGGIFAAMKGPDVEEEVAGAQKAIALMGGRVQEVKTFQLQDAGRRTLVIIEKVADTPAGYPRHGSKIAKNPL